ncbi:MAG: type II secretion system F family protein [Lachnospiraceae bacterium]|nr:type II secretion system F family protein [Lachnospiraceae bacterium]
MPDFSYVAIDKDGNTVKGSVQAADEVAIRSKLKIDGLTLVQAKKQGMLSKDISFGSGKVKTRDMSVFCRQFSSVLSAGVTVVEALRMLAEQTENKTLKNALIKTRENVQQGDTLAEAMAKSPKVFDNMFTNMIAAGEESGNLETCIVRLGTQLEKSAKLKAMVKGAMIYPIAVVIVAIGVLILMSLLVVPKFADMFSSMGAELPGSTKAVLAISSFLMYKWYILIIIVVTVIVAYKAFGKTNTGKHVYGKISLKLPIFGDLNLKSQSASFSRTMSTLVSSGMSIPASLEIVAKAMSNILYTDVLVKAKDDVEQGVPLSVPIRKAPEFPPMVHNMLAIGEETGSIEHMLEKVAEYYEEETEQATANLAAVLQPVIIIVLGGMVGWLVLAMYQPMISMYGGMGNL